MDLVKRLVPVLIIFHTIIAIGTIGFHLVEGWNWADSIYMSIITVFTVGFTEVQPLSQRGEIFTIVLILLGLGGITYTFSAITNYIVAGEVRGLLKGRRMRRYIDSLSGHFVVCGYGEMGRQVCKELRRQGKSLVIADINEEAVEQARNDGFLAILGDAGLDTVLIQCGIKRADGLVVATDEDASNLLVVLSARGFRDDLPIIARANLEEVRDKLLRSGANGVLFPQGVAGRRMAQMLLHPEITDFLDVITHEESLELILEKLTVSEGSVLENRSLKDARVREQTGASIVGLKREGEGVIPSLQSTMELQAGDIVFALGTREQLDQLGEWLGS
jgi:voltage-gated potassium channel